MGGVGGGEFVTQTGVLERILDLGFVGDPTEINDKVITTIAQSFTAATTAAIIVMRTPPPPPS